MENIKNLTWQGLKWVGIFVTMILSVMLIIPILFPSTISQQVKIFPTSKWQASSFIRAYLDMIREVASTAQNVRGVRINIQHMKTLIHRTIILLLMGVSFSCRKAPLAEEFNSGNQVFYTITDSAKWQEGQGRADLALRYHKLALMHAQAKGLHQQQAEALVEIAKLLPLKDSDTSLRYLNNALVIASSLKHFRLQSAIYHAIAEIHKQQHNYTAAIFALEANHALTDSLLNERRRKDIQQIHSRENLERERIITVVIALSLFAIAVVLGFFFRRTRKLNHKLSESVMIRNKLFSIISHDLRGPAGSLKQALDLIERGAVSAEELPEFLKMLKDQSFILNDTLDNLLIWSRSQLSESKSHPVSFLALPTVNDSLVLLSGQYVSKNISINLNVPADLTLYADRDQFDFILRNLVSNAIKFSMPGGRIDISISQKRHHSEVTVRDYGIGISSQRQAQFLSGNLDTTYGTSGEKGTGLGLRMVKDFIDAAGGNISLTSRSGETSFCFSLPVAIGHNG